MTTWADVVEPSTRALVDDDSEDELTENQLGENPTQVELVWKREKDSNIDLLIVAHGKLCTLFASKFVCEEYQEPFAEIRESSSKESLGKALTYPVYQISKGAFICLCKDSDINNANKFRNALLPLLQNSAQIVIVSTLKASTYIYDKYAGELSVPFIRCLHSSTYKSQDIELSYLEQPNIVTGVPAAILSWCEVFKAPGILHCCFSDTDELNSISAEPLVTVFGNLSPKILDVNRVKFKRESYGPVTTNLYL